ncbi:GlcNAc-transferase family protein [Morganella morganii]|uniref:GlcNAc-transferase family protein n=1 Tax=Morganella morganii TaxID=582 RepID=UPI003EB743CE
MKNTIFVSIASYRDPELIPTIKNMIAHAAAPDKIVISVCWQVENKDISVFTDIGATEIESGSDNPDIFRLNYQGAILHIHYINIYQARGACWARYCAELAFNHEDYFLQIDSHCRFIENWDSEIINYYLKLSEEVKKPVITGYPPSYTPATEDKEEILTTGTCRIVFNEFNDTDIPAFKPIAITDTSNYERGSYIAGGFAFSAGNFTVDVPNDPNLFFLGEEISMSARAFTRGYNVVYPEKIFVWHYYTREECNKIWGDLNQESVEKKLVKKGWWEWDLISKQRVRYLLGIKIDEDVDLGKYCLGNIRTLEQFEYLTGIYFREQLVVPELIKDPKPAMFDDIPESRDAWLTRLYSPFYQAVTIDKSELAANDDNVDYWSLGVFTEDNQLIAMQRLTTEEMAEQVSDDNQESYKLEIKLKDKSCLIPKKLRLAPFFTDCGWGETVEKVW